MGSSNVDAPDPAAKMSSPTKSCAFSLTSSKLERRREESVCSLEKRTCLFLWQIDTLSNYILNIYDYTCRPRLLSGLGQGTFSVQSPWRDAELVTALSLRYWVLSPRRDISINLTITEAHGTLQRNRQKEQNRQRTGRSAVFWTWSNGSCCYLHKTYIKSIQPQSWQRWPMPSLGPRS